MFIYSENEKVRGHEFGAVGEKLEIAKIADAVSGECYTYAISIENEELQEIVFQHGVVPEHGVNGITEGALLAVVADRLRGHQSGPFGCRENALALTKIEEALHWMEARTKDRLKRGVEGSLAK